MTIKLGDRVVDTLTGFTGIAISRVEYINGCVQYSVQPPIDKDGKLPESIYLDIQRLVVAEVKREAPKIPQPAGVTGGPQRDAPSSTYRG